MRPNHHWVWVPLALELGVYLLIQNRAFAKPADGHKAEREAINSVLSAQQNAWNRGDVDAFLVEYWHSPELTFPGNSGAARGWQRALARYKKNYSARAALWQLG